MSRSFGAVRLASFALEEYETALEAFRRGQQAAMALPNGEAKSDSRKYPTWIRKCEAEMEADDVEMEASVDETHKEPPGPAAMDASPAPSAAAGAVAARTQPEASAPLHVRVKFQYYQSFEKITVSILERGLTEDQVEVEVTAKRLTVRRRRDLALLFDKVLYDEVVVDKHRTRFVPAKASGAGGSLSRRRAAQGDHSVRAFCSLLTWSLGRKGLTVEERKLRLWFASNDVGGLGGPEQESRHPSVCHPVVTLN